MKSTKFKIKNILLGASLLVAGGFNLQADPPMGVKIEQHLVKVLFFRPDLVEVIKSFLPDIIPLNMNPKAYRTSPFSKFFKKNGIKVTGEKLSSFQTEKSEEQSKLEQIIEEDSLEEFQKETKGISNIVFKDFFFEVSEVEIPILHYCVTKGAIRCFKFLLLNGADPLQKLSLPGSLYSWDCMTVAICFGQWEMMKILGERGIKKLDNPSVWEAAALTHRNNLLKIFISNKDEIDPQIFMECLRKGTMGATKGNNLKGFRLLRQNCRRIRPNTADTLLFIATKFDNLELGKWLLLEGASIYAKDIGDTPLHIAARYNSIQMGELLISKEANIEATDADGNTPLHCAVKNGSIQMVKLLAPECYKHQFGNVTYLEAKNRDGESPLALAIKNDDLEIVKVLIANHAEYERAFNPGYYFHLVAKYDASRVGKWLISKGIWHYIDIPNYNNKKTPLHTAVENDSVKIGELLISSGADINAKDNFGITPLHWAAEKDSVKIGELLISKGVDINAKDDKGRTPLHYAAQKDLTKIGNLLICNDADINAKDNKGRTPLALAQIRPQSQMEQLLRFLGAH